MKRWLFVAWVTWVALGCQRDAAKESRPPAPAQAESKPAPAIRVAAASDLTRAFEALRSSFERETQRKVELSFGASGMLAKQVGAGAPFDVFASANTGFVDQVVQAGACSAQTRAPYALGHLVVWSKPGLVKPASQLEELADPRFKRIAIANPEHAPYGKAAKEALTKAGIWRQVEPRLVYGENIKQTMQYAESGNVEAALVALSLAVDGGPASYLRVDESMHAPIDQTLVVCSHGEDRAGGQAFASYVNSPAGRAVMRRYGLMLAGESLAAK
jgi:molybdate transport system substrate-binding protein